MGEEEVVVQPRSFEIADDGDEASQINGGQDEVPDGGQEVVQTWLTKDAHSEKMTRKRVLDAFLDDLMPSDEEEKVYCSLKNISIRMEDTGETGQAKDSSETTEVEKRKSRTAVKFIDYSDDSAGNSEPPSKKSKAESAVKKRETGKFINECNKSESNGNESDSGYKCPKCDYSIKNIRSWTDHLQRKHNTTPSREGLALRCECGHESLTEHHSRTCKIGKCKVIRRSEMTTATNGDSALKCPDCDFSTISPRFFVDHLKKQHSTTPILAGLALRCECGNESFSAAHSYRCNVSKFTVINKSEMTPLSTPQCVLCEMGPKTATGYVYHLRKGHKSTLNANGIYIICSCGLKIVAERKGGFGEHTKKASFRNFLDIWPRTTTPIGKWVVKMIGIEYSCDGRDFTLHKLSEE